MHKGMSEGSEVPCIFLLRSKCIALVKITDFLPLRDIHCHSCDNEIGKNQRTEIHFRLLVMGGKQSNARTL